MSTTVNGVRASAVEQSIADACMDDDGCPPALAGWGLSGYREPSSNRWRPQAALEHTLGGELAKAPGISVAEFCCAPLTFIIPTDGELDLILPSYICRRGDGIPRPVTEPERGWVRPSEWRNYMVLANSAGLVATPDRHVVSVPPRCGRLPTQPPPTPLGAGRGFAGLACCTSRHAVGKSTVSAQSSALRALLVVASASLAVDEFSRCGNRWAGWANQFLMPDGPQNINLDFDGLTLANAANPLSVLG